MAPPCISQTRPVVGLAPFNRDSGTFRGRRMIRGGRASIRRVLYMATVTATRHNPVIAGFYHRLRTTGHPGKVALTAAMTRMTVAQGSQPHSR
jgi:transposase